MLNKILKVNLGGPKILIDFLRSVKDLIRNHIQHLVFIVEIDIVVIQYCRFYLHSKKFWFSYNF